MGFRDVFRAVDLIVQHDEHPFVPCLVVNGRTDGGDEVIQPVRADFVA